MTNIKEQAKQHAPRKKQRSASIAAIMGGLVLIGGIIGVTYLTSYKGLELEERIVSDVRVFLPKEFREVSDDNNSNPHDIRARFNSSGMSTDSTAPVSAITVLHLDNETWALTQDKAIAEADSSSTMVLSFSRHPELNSEVSDRKIGTITKKQLTVNGFPARHYSFDVMTKRGEPTGREHLLYIFGNTTLYGVEIFIPPNDQKLEQSVDRIVSSVRIEK